MKKLLVENHIYLDNGEIFGEDGRGFQRINLACPRATLEKMLLRFKSGMEKVYAEWEENGRPYHQTLSVGTKLENFTYDSVYGKNRTLPNKKTLIVFSRFFDCEITSAMLKLAAGIYPALSLAGCDLKFIIQSDVSEIESAQKKYKFEIIADKDARLYDMYNVFEADGVMNVIADDKLVNAFIGKDIKKLLRMKIFDRVSSLVLGSMSGEGDDGKRQLQLPAFVCVDDNLTVTYSHYCKTVSDLPNAVKLLKGVRNSGRS